MDTSFIIISTVYLLYEEFNHFHSETGINRTECGLVQDCLKSVYEDAKIENCEEVTNSSFAQKLLRGFKSEDKSKLDWLQRIALDSLRIGAASSSLLFLIN